MSKQIEALKLALEALNGSQYKMNQYGYQAMETTIAANNKAITAIREALAERFCDNNCTWRDHHPDCDKAEQPAPPPECQTEAEKTAFAFGWWKALEMHRKPAQQQEPFGYFRYDLRLDAWVQNREGRPGTPFYTSPPASKPLTDDEIDMIYTGVRAVHHDIDSYVFARAIEAAHGIGEKK